MRGVPIRWLLVGANVLVFSMPVVALLALRVYDAYLLRQTERQLIAQAVLIAESWRESEAQHRSGSVNDFRPPTRQGDRYVPIEPAVGNQTRIHPPQPPPQPCASLRDDSWAHAAAPLTAMLIRAQVFNLSAIRLIDRYGCVRATTRGELGADLSPFPEVDGALAGHYTTVLRERISDEPLASLGDNRRRGDTRVFAALPVFSGDQVVGVVRLSRTSLSAFESLWQNRRGLVVGLGLAAALVLLNTVLFARAITRPLRRLEADARTIVSGGESDFTQPFWSPRELQSLAYSVATMSQTLHARAHYVASYTADLTHELKTPLTSIRGAAELLRDSYDAMSPSQRARFLRNIEDDAQRMDRLVNQLLRLAELENAPRAQPEESINVEQFLRQCAERFGDQVTLEFNAPPRMLDISALDLESVVLNLIENGLDSGTRVTVAAAEHEGRLLLTVKDNGPGIPENQRTAIFERFFTTKGEAGTGLGLPLVAAIACSRGGTLRLEDSDLGAVFTVLL